MKKERSKKEEGVLYYLYSFNPLAKIIFIKTRQQKARTKKEKKREGNSSYHSSDSTPLPQHESK